MEQPKWHQLVQTQAKSQGRTRKRISTKDDDAKTIEILGAMAKTLQILGSTLEEACLKKGFLFS
jgi:hypothetical protein